MRSPRVYARALAVFYGLLAVLGLIPAMNTLFGLVPIHGHDVWLHAGTALVAAYFGWRGQTEVERRAKPRPTAGREPSPSRTSAATATATGVYRAARCRKGSLRA